MILTEQELRNLAFMAEEAGRKISNTTELNMGIKRDQLNRAIRWFDIADALRKQARHGLGLAE